MSASHCSNIPYAWALFMYFCVELWVSFEARGLMLTMLAAGIPCCNNNSAQPSQACAAQAAAAWLALPANFGSSTAQL
jgi:hypothetical protein